MSTFLSAAIPFLPSMVMSLRSLGLYTTLVRNGGLENPDLELYVKSGKHTVVGKPTLD